MIARLCVDIINYFIASVCHEYLSIQATAFARAPHFASNFENLEASYLTRYVR